MRSQASSFFLQEEEEAPLAPARADTEASSRELALRQNITMEGGDAADDGGELNLLCDF